MIKIINMIPRKKNTQKFFSKSLKMILILTLIIFFLQILELGVLVESQHIIADNEISSRTSDNITAPLHTALKLGVQYLEDDFYNDSKIDFTENVVVDTRTGGLKLLRILRTFGGIYRDEAWSICQTSDGGYILTGYSEVNPELKMEIWLIKLDSSGTMEWNVTFGDVADNIGYSVRPTADGGYILAAGTTTSYAVGDTETWLIKTDNNGSKQWLKKYPPIDVRTVNSTSDGGYIIVGGYPIIWLIKTDNNGTMQWNRSFRIGDKIYDHAWGEAGFQTSDGGYILVATIYLGMKKQEDILLIKTDDSGNMLWNKTFGGIDVDWGSSIEPTTDQGYIIVGRTFSYGNGNGMSDVWLIKTNSSGVEQWNRTFGDANIDWGRSVQQTSDGGYIITGATILPDDMTEDLLLIKTNGTGFEEWNLTYGGHSREAGYSVRQTQDNGYIVSGMTYSYGKGEWDMLVMKTNSTGSYNPKGYLISKNVLNGTNATSLRSFDYNASIPKGTSISIQFSENRSLWYNSQGYFGGDLLINGENSLDISLLNCNNSSLYYRLEFVSRFIYPDNNDYGRPILKKINISYI